MHNALIFVALTLAVPGTITVLHLSTMAIASMLYRERLPKGDVAEVRFLVVVPAHQEELVLAETLEAITDSMRSRDRLLVVDDRSTDRTGEIARSFGAEVLRREPGDEPGRAAARQAAIDRSVELEWDAMVMIDADSIIEPGFFDACERMLATGAIAIQARSEAAIGHRLVDQAALASFAVQGVLLPRGRDRLGLLVRLRGTGMVLHRSIVERFGFRGAASEDLVLSLDLCRAGLSIRHLESARLRSQNAGSWRTATVQKLRYEAGRKSAGHEFLSGLRLGAGRSSFEAAWFLISPPFATAATWLGAALLASFFAEVPALTWTILGLLGALSAVLVTALVQARVSPTIVLALLLAPAYVAWKLIVQIRALISTVLGPREFGATERHRTERRVT
jgi:1,2-diacylglycerol 3-beta-glucosyltransferase